MRRTIRVEIETDESGKYCDKNCPLAIAMGAVCKLEEDDYLDADKTGEIRCPACLSAEYTENLEIAKRGGLIRDYRRQVSVPLTVNGVTVAHWRIDFEVERIDGSKYYLEIKGLPTDTYLLKLKLFLALYPTTECWVNHERISKCGQERKF